MPSAGKPASSDLETKKEFFCEPLFFSVVLCVTNIFLEGELHREPQSMHRETQRFAVT
jgi:hypothetical protein